MEDKRTLLAFLLIGLILLLIPYYYEWVGLAPTPVEEGQPAGQPRESTTTAPVQTAAPTTTGRKPEDPPKVVEIASIQDTKAPAMAARNITVSTPLQELIFTTHGGVLTSARLLRYSKLDGSVVDLVHAGGRGLVLAIRDGDREIDLTGVEFVPEFEALRLEAGEHGTLRMTADLGDGKSIEKVSRFYADRHGFEMDIRYQGFSGEPNLLIGWEQGIANTEEKPGSDMPGGLAGAQAIGSIAYMKNERISVDEDDPMVADRGDLSWAGVSNQYFFLAVAPAEEGHYSLELYSPHVDDPFRWEQYSFRVGSRMHGSGIFRTVVYAGPLDYEELGAYGLDLEQGIDLGWPIIRDISRVLLIIFLAAHDYVPNYGWVLILFALAIKALVYPLTHKSYESMGKMQALQPKIAGLREKYKNDNQRLSQATMKLYKEEGVNPLGGCLPMLLQMPVFFALYRLFYNIELRQAPFVLWIEDLSRPEEIMIAGFGLHVLPILMAVSMFVQQKMTMKDPKQAMLVYLMPAFLLFIFWSLPSGLVLYWTVFNILQIGQQLLVNHYKLSPKPEATQSLK